MGTRRIRLFSNLRRRLGFHVARPWSSKERLRVSVPAVYAGDGDGVIERPDGYGGSYYLVPLLDESDRAQWGVREDHRPRPFDGEGARSLGDARSRTVSGGGPTCQTFNPDGFVAGHESETVGGFTAILDCE